MSIIKFVFFSFKKIEKLSEKKESDGDEKSKGEGRGRNNFFFPINIDCKKKRNCEKPNKKKAFTSK